MVFGDGTKLEVKPDITDSDPSVYQLKPKDKEMETDQSAQKEIGVCLFTDYSSHTLQVGINKNTQPTNGSLVVVKEDEYDEKGTASYGIVLWGTLDDEFHCNAVMNGKTFETNPEDAGTCSAEDEKPVFEADERLNLLSLSVLGLRIIFFKTIAFNVLFTFRVYSRRGRK
ncbi:T cell receptor alpha chain MC.7.G5-like [Pogona vitticeps]